MYNLVKKHIIHGPCGSFNIECPCMVTKKPHVSPSCKYKYPRIFSNETIFEENSFPVYRRRNTPTTVDVRGLELDNRWVVPYNPYLLMKFDCHINIEVCATIQSIKYMYKYIYKGHDRVSLTLSGSHDVYEVDEIKNFQNA